MRWTRIALFAYSPAALAMAAGVLADNLLTRLGNPQFGIYAFAAGTLVAVILVAISAMRLRSWESGGSDGCESCSGPLSWIPRNGRRWYGRQLRDFHYCWNCGKANGFD